MEQQITIEFDGRKRKVTRTFSLEGSAGGEKMKMCGWEPTYFICGKSYTFIKSRVDGSYFPHTAATTPEVAPGWVQLLVEGR